MLFGRNNEIRDLKNLGKKKTASLLVLKGRRRIGKSYLLETFGSSYGKFVEIVGMSLDEMSRTKKTQLQNFAEQLSQVEGLPGLQFNNWTEAFSALAKFNEKEKVFILLDEISWMAHGSDDFVGKLKIAWDTKFKHNSKLMLALCGSVSSWIDKNLLKDRNFVGRISWKHQLPPLDINHCSKFWGNNGISKREVLKTLLVTGCIPKYLEEIIPAQPAEENIKRLCFNQSGYLFQEFDDIFKDIFEDRSEIYGKILEKLVEKKLALNELAESLGRSQSGYLTEYIEDLLTAGFISRDHTWDLSGKESKLSKLRVRDNYVRFYLKYIVPKKQSIKKETYRFSSLDQLINWDSIAGLQFENLVLDNIELVLDELGLNPSNILQYGPFFQTKTKRRKGCQIDLLIQDKYNSLLLCEIKFRKKIGLGIISDVEEKIRRLKIPRGYSIRPVLIYSGELTNDLKSSEFFVDMIDFEIMI